MSALTSFLLNKNAISPLWGVVVASAHLAGYLTVNLVKATDTGASVASRTSASIVASKTIEHASKASLSPQIISVFTFMVVAILSAVVTYQRQAVPVTSSSSLKDGDEPPYSGESGTQGGPDQKKPRLSDADTNGRVTSGDEPPPSPPSPGAVSEASRKPWTTWLLRWLFWLLLSVAIQVLWKLYGPSWFSILSYLTVGSGKGLGLMCVGWAIGMPFEQVDVLVLNLQEAFYRSKDLGHKIVAITGMLKFKIPVVFSTIYSTLLFFYCCGVFVCSCSKFIYKFFRSFLVDVTWWSLISLWLNLLIICFLVVRIYFVYIVLTYWVALWLLQESVLAIMYWLDELPFILNVVSCLLFPLSACL